MVGLMPRVIFDRDSPSTYNSLAARLAQRLRNFTEPGRYDLMLVSEDIEIARHPLWLLEEEPPEERSPD